MTKTKYLIKKFIISNLINLKKSKNKFNEKFAENFVIPKSEDSTFNNSYYFSSHNANGQSFFIYYGLRNNHPTEVWFTYREKDKFYTQVKQLYEPDECPIKISLIECSKKWKLEFIGKVIEKDTNIIVDAKFTGEFEAINNIYNFFNHDESNTVAKSVAREKWSKSFFEELNKNNQTHYEQTGRIRGNLNIDGQDYNINGPAIRDHSYGKRDWDYMNRHIWLMGLTENNESFVVSMVSYPVLKKIEIGNIFWNNKYESIKKINAYWDEVNEIIVPRRFMFQFETISGKKYNVIAKSETFVPFTFADSKYTLLEGIGNFEINGNKARGIMEFGYNTDLKRWKK